MAASADGDGWACDLDRQVVTCVLDGPLDVGDVTGIALDVRVGPQAAPGVVNVAEVGSDAEDLDPTNGRDDDPVDVTPVSELTVDKDAVDESDGHLTWEITVANERPNATTEPIVAVDDLADELTFASASGDGWSCTVDGQVVTCVFEESLEVDETTVLTLVTDVDADEGTTIANAVEISGGGVDAATVTTDTEATVGELARTGGTPLRLLLFGLAMLGAGVAIFRRREPGDGPQLRGTIRNPTERDETPWARLMTRGWRGRS